MCFILIFLPLILDAAVQQLRRVSSQIYVDDHIVSASGATRHNMVASQTIPLINVVPCEPVVTRSPRCSEPDLDVPDSDANWDVATVPTVDSLALATSSNSAVGVNSPAHLFSAHAAVHTQGGESDPAITLLPNSGQSELASVSTVTASGIEVGSPEVLRSAGSNGSLVPSYGSTGGLISSGSFPLH